MKPEELERSKEYIEKLEIIDVSPEIVQLDLGKLKFSDGQEAAYVNKGSLVSFVSGVSQTNQSDVLNSTLLAQLGADRAHDRENDTENWYKKYREVLGYCGWVIQDFQFVKFSTSGGSFTVEKVILEVLRAIATDNEIAIVIKALDALRGLSNDDGKLVLWETSSHSAQKGNFQIAVCADSGGVIVTKIGAFYFSTTQNVTQVLWFEFSSADASLYQGSQIINLNKDIYNQIRQQIIDKLGDRAKQYIADLPI